MTAYYSEKLCGERLRRCYDIASPRVKQYLEAESEYLLTKISPGDRILDLGCGYGRIIPRLSRKAGTVVGIDISIPSLTYAKEWLRGVSGFHLLASNALSLPFPDRTFDRVACIQNGISAFNVNQRDLIGECLRVTRPGGLVLFSTYAEEFWGPRLEWFQRQSEEGLLGKIDYDNTGNGVIACLDGFVATTVTEEQFLELVEGFCVETTFSKIDQSSLFCELRIRGNLDKA